MGCAATKVHGAADTVVESSAASVLSSTKHHLDPIEVFISRISATQADSDAPSTQAEPRDHHSAAADFESFLHDEGNGYLDGGPPPPQPEIVALSPDVIDSQDDSTPSLYLLSIFSSGVGAARRFIHCNCYGERMLVEPCLSTPISSCLYHSEITLGQHTLFGPPIRGVNFGKATSGILRRCAVSRSGRLCVVSMSWKPNCLMACQPDCLLEPPLDHEFEKSGGSLTNYMPYSGSPHDILGGSREPSSLKGRSFASTTVSELAVMLQRLSHPCILPVEAVHKVAYRDFGVSREDTVNRSLLAVIEPDVTGPSLIICRPSKGHAGGVDDNHRLRVPKLPLCMLPHVISSLASGLEYTSLVGMAGGIHLATPVLHKGQIVWTGFAPQLLLPRHYLAAAEHVYRAPLLAPELITNPYSCNDSKCDIWTLGVLVWGWATGELPFELPQSKSSVTPRDKSKFLSLPVAIQRIKKLPMLPEPDTYQQHIEDIVGSQVLAHLVYSMLHDSPDSRLAAHGVRCHPFVAAAESLVIKGPVKFLALSDYVVQAPLPESPAPAKTVPDIATHDEDDHTVYSESSSAAFLRVESSGDIDPDKNLSPNSSRSSLNRSRYTRDAAGARVLSLKGSALLHVRETTAARDRNPYPFVQNSSVYSILTESSTGSGTLPSASLVPRQVGAPITISAEDKIAASKVIRAAPSRFFDDGPILVFAEVFFPFGRKQSSHDNYHSGQLRFRTVGRAHGPYIYAQQRSRSYSHTPRVPANLSQARRINVEYFELVSGKRFGVM